MVASASHLFALAHGGDCVGPNRCALCGAPCGDRPASELLKPGSFTGWAGLADPASAFACDGCDLAARESATVPMIDGAVREQAVGATRTFSWVVTRERAVAAHKGTWPNSGRSACRPRPRPTPWC